MVRLRGHRPRWVSTSVGRVHLIDVRGRGALPPVVIIHGFSAAGAHYFPLIFRLDKHVRWILAPDMPAHGLSEVPGDVEPDTLRRGLFEALDQALDEPAILIGNSMGGLASIRYAAHNPEMVRGLVLISPAGAWSDRVELQEMHRTFEIASHRDALEFVDRLFPERTWMRHAYALGVRRKFRRPLMRRLLAGLEPEMLEARALSSLLMPIRVIWGKRDRIFPASHRAFFRAHLPRHAVFHEPRDFGHAPFLDRPDALTDHVLEFLRHPDVNATHLLRRQRIGQ